MSTSRTDTKRSGQTNAADESHGSSNACTDAGSTAGNDAKPGERCRWCGSIFLTRSGPGRPRVYCSQSCRQQHYVERRTAVGDGRDPTRVVVERERYDLYESRRLQLQLALDDLSRAKASATETRPELYDWVIDYARQLVNTDLDVPDV